MMDTQQQCWDTSQKHKHNLENLDLALFEEPMLEYADRNSQHDSEDFGEHYNNEISTHDSNDNCDHDNNARSNNKDNIDHVTYERNNHANNNTRGNTNKTTNKNMNKNETLLTLRLPLALQLLLFRR